MSLAVAGLCRRPSFYYSVSVDNISLANPIVKCDLDILHHLGNAVSPAGTTTFPGIADRMQKDPSLSSVAISIIVYFAVDIPVNICAPPSVNRPCGPAAQSRRPSTPSKACGVPSKSMTSPAPVPFIAVHFPCSSPSCSLLMGLSSQQRGGVYML
jgi:hypothetical protein